MFVEEYWWERSSGSMWPKSLRGNPNTEAVCYPEKKRLLDVATPCGKWDGRLDQQKGRLRARTVKLETHCLGGRTCQT